MHVSFSKSIEGLEYLLDSTPIGFNVTAVTKTRIVKNKFPVSDINYSYEYYLSHLQEIHYYT